MAFRAAIVLPPLASRSLPARTTLRPLARLPTASPSPLVLLSTRRWYAEKKPEPHGRPGHAHSSVRDMAESAKQEITDASAKVADSIAGGHAARALGGVGEQMADFGASLKIPATVPNQAWYFGAAGLVPYLATSLASIYLARQASLAKSAGLTSAMDFDTADALLWHVQQVQLSYGAIILSFLGAIHWGFEFAGYGGRQGSKRYILGLLPLALAWPSLLLQPAQGLTTQLLAFFLAWYSDNRATSWGWTPRWYSLYRFGLTAVVGSTIMLSLVGASYFDPKLKVMGIGEGAMRQRAELRDRVSEVTDTTYKTEIPHTDVTLEAAGEDADAYLQLHDYGEERRKKEEEEAKEREEQEKAEQAEQDEAKSHESEKKTQEVTE